jgi:hypothetical protein
VIVFKQSEIKNSERCLAHKFVSGDVFLDASPHYGDRISILLAKRKDWNDRGATTWFVLLGNGDIATCLFYEYTYYEVI